MVSLDGQMDGDKVENDLKLMEDFVESGRGKELWDAVVKVRDRRSEVSGVEGGDRCELHASALCFDEMISTTLKGLCIKKCIFDMRQHIYDMRQKNTYPPSVYPNPYSPCTSWTRETLRRATTLTPTSRATGMICTSGGAGAFP
jgi:hypothetical protein